MPKGEVKIGRCKRQVSSLYGDCDLVSNKHNFIITLFHPFRVLVRESACLSLGAAQGCCLQAFQACLTLQFFVLQSGPLFEVCDVVCYLAPEGLESHTKSNETSTKSKVMPRQLNITC